MKCKDLGGSVVIDGKTYRTKNKFENNTYTYYPEDEGQPHFTVVDTDGGKAEFKSFHITVIIEKNDGKATKNFHLYFEQGAYTRHNYNDKQFKDYSEGWKKVIDNLSKYKTMGQSFWKKMNKK